MNSQYAAPDSRRVASAWWGILLGVFGIHKFILGYRNEGIAMLAATVIGGPLTGEIIPSIVGAIGLVEGIIYLCKTDVEFYSEYVVSKRPWF